MKVLIVSQYFYPEQFRINDIAKELSERGYKLKVVTGIPNYPRGRFYKGYNIFGPRREKFHNIPIYRIPIVPRGKNNFTLSVNYISFVTSGTLWAIFSKENPDIIFAFGTSPITQAIPAILLGKRKKVPVILYLQDLWPETVIEVLNIKNKFLKKFFSKISDYVYRNSSKILVSSKSFADRLISRGIPNTKVEFVPQYAEEFYKPVPKKNTGLVSQDRFNIVYTGNVGYVQGLEKLVEAAKILKESEKTNVHFNIVGDGRFKDELIEIAKNKGVIDSFTFIPQQPAQKIPEILAECDLAYLSLKDSLIGRITIPAKLQSYMACGIPVLAVIRGEAANIVKEAQCGFVVEEDEPHKIAEVIEKVSQMQKKELAQLGTNGLKYYDQHFSKTVIMDKIGRIISELIDHKEEMENG